MKRIWIIGFLIVAVFACVATTPQVVEKEVIKETVVVEEEKVVEEVQAVTDTPLPTNTPLPLTDTPVPPAPTLAPTDTPVPPTPTLAPTEPPTPTFEPFTRWLVEPGGSDLLLWKTLDQEDGAVGIVASGTEVRLVDYRDGHYLARAGEIEGWIHESYVTDQAPVAAPPPPEPTSTDTPTTAYQFLPDGPARPDMSFPCPGCPKAPAYIVGTVRDAGGNPLEGVRLVCYNDWYRSDVIGSKGGSDIGRYDFIINQAPATWYVVVLDEADRPISPEAAVDFDPLVAGRYIQDWRRTY